MKKWQRTLAIVAIVAFLAGLAGCKANDCGCPKFQLEQSGDILE